MDTKLKKFSLSAFFKFIAVILCLACVGVSVCYAASAYITAEKRELNATNFQDVINGNGADGIWDTGSFTREYRIFCEKLSVLIDNYGDGSKETYQTKLENYEKQNSEAFENIRKNLILQLNQDQSFYDYIIALSSGDVVNCGFIESISDTGETSSYWESDILGDDVDYDWLSSSYYSERSDFTDLPMTKDAAEAFERTKADGIIELEGTFEIVNGSGETVSVYPGGYYLFKVDNERLETNLTANGNINQGYMSFEDFTKQYTEQKQYIDENFPSGRYFIKDESGKIFTNMENLGEKTDEEKVTAAFEKMGFYAKEEQGGYMLLPDGRYYTDLVYYDGLEGAYGYDDSHFDETTAMAYTTTFPVVSIQEENPTEITQHTTVTETTTLIPSEPTTYVQITDPTTSFEVTVPESVTKPVSSADTKQKNTTAYIGVDMHSDSYKNGLCRFSQVEDKIVLARDTAKQTIIICGVCVLLFAVLFLLLMLRSGRRFGDKEKVHMLFGDRMFTDLRIIIDGAAIFASGFGIVCIVDEFFFNSNVNEFVILALGAVCCVLAAVVLDLVLFITRHLKNKSLFKRVSLVWIIRKTANKYKSTVSPFIKEKLLYTKDFRKNTAITIAVVTVINVIGVISGSIEMVTNSTCVIAVILAFFDLAVFIQLIRFIAGVEKILRVLEEIGKGNYEVHINLMSLPSSLRESAKKLMSLRDGVKNAVTEAVKQEQTKTELITNVSHDLKTPLTSVINYVELLKKCDITDETAKEYLSILGEKSDRLKRLIEDLVEASKAATGNIRLTPVQVSLNEILNQITGEFADEFEKRKLTVISDIPQENITVYTDSKTLYRILENLMGNVAKYAMENTRVYLSLENRGSEKLIVLKNISGSPLNISAEQLMERFVRGDEARSTSGNGLGLSIAQNLCNVLGGKLKIEINGDLFVATVSL